MPRIVQTEVLVASRRRCALCFGLLHDTDPKPGQIAHLDRNPNNNEFDNLAWLCLTHHDQYDSRTSQSKGLTIEETKHYRGELGAFIEKTRKTIEPIPIGIRLSEQGARLAELLNIRSQNGHKFDPTLRVAELPEILALGTQEVEEASDELAEQKLIELNGSADFIYALDRLFWETDPIFSDNDPVSDCRSVATVVTEANQVRVELREIGAQLGWQPRRLNPATTFLAECGIVEPVLAIATAPFALAGVVRTTRTRRFIKDQPQRNIRNVTSQGAGP
jgi:hypothetical protein